MAILLSKDSQTLLEQADEAAVFGDPFVIEGLLDRTRQLILTSRRLRRRNRSRRPTGIPQHPIRRARVRTSRRHAPGHELPARHGLKRASHAVLVNERAGGVKILRMTKRISTTAYQALRDALPAVVWNLPAFESLLRTALRGHPELLAGLDFKQPKRITADELLDRLITGEHKYQGLTLQLMSEISSMRRFPNLERIKEEPERRKRMTEAEQAVAHLADLMKPYSEALAEQERQAVARAEHATRSTKLRTFADDLERLHQEYLRLETVEPHQRGYELERFLNQLFALFDMEPRLGYVTGSEQIDGSLNYDTDDYIVEAKWRKDVTGRDDVDVFAEKVRRKGKNALGLFISVNGFAATATARYDESTPFLAVDGGDLLCVLEQRMRLDDMLRAKRRHANETGSCYISAFALLAT